MYIRKVLSFVDSELELLKLKIKYPEQFQTTHPQPLQSNLFLAPKSKNLGIVGMAEIVVSFYHSGEIIGIDGKPAPLISFGRAFEQAFNLDFGNIYDKQDAIFNRKPYNLAKTLDALKNTILREAKKQHAK